ncbi:MAG: DNA gyrase subunit A [Bacteroidales bacterium]|jgi:DNA gyrase subunit A|nr:DNA gyrase subunit A [Bacteroidales bacterium]MED9961988.1 DNA gyrase subunit A [Bacteroidales bacterium]MEE0881897.1 DNA gyrase subunit A [Bacteroidales bacterium]MEE1118984.1 DNA gyrase subunit A [Bacteroidales bacterium]MEE1253162.1 DNA gyrase subunit A [Bacteroidales bacterium]
MNLENEKIQRVNIETQMKQAYIDYAMSVIVSRALPDARDGMKPVHRRILFAMGDMGMTYNTKHKKSARIVGEVLGKYHPHGDSSVYMAMVRMAQKWSLRYTMIDGQGNFGSIDLDPPAAMRYTEARMSKIADEMLADINKDTVDFTKNFDDSLDEPTVLPNKIPYLMINGTNGIAVGMATNMAPHNLTECIDGIIAYIDNKEISIDELMQYIKAPDFPTGGIIYGYDGVREAFHTGRGHIVIRANAHFEQDKHSDAEQIVVTSVPYQVCKSDMIKRQAALVEEKKIEGISRIKDESNKDGIRIVYKLKRDAMSNVVLNKLYQYSDLQTSFSINNIALVKGKPQLLNLKDMIECFVNHRHEVVERRTRFELAKAEERMHIVEGLLKALDFIDEIINIIRNSETIAQAKLEMQDRFGFTEIQSSAIVEMRLRQLAGLERQKLQDEYNELLAFINRCREILSNESVLMQVIKDELLEIRQKYGDERLSTIEYSSADFRIEDMIKNEEVVVSISHMGYIKRTPLAEYKVQNRGGKGSRGGALRDEDFIEHIYIASMHDYVLFFTEKGKCYWLRAFELPEGTKTTKGRMIKNILNIEDDDRIKAYVTTKDLRDKEYVESNNIIMCTKYGHIKKTTLEAYSRPRQKGILAFGLKEGDELLEAKLTSGSDEILIATRSGKCIRFNESTVRPMGRTAAGVKAISISEEDDFVIGMVVAKEDSDILVVSEHGYGKRSKLEEYRITNRGGKGIKTLNITEKTGDLVAIKQVDDDFDLMIMNRSGLTIRMHVADIRQQGRATQGVKLINIKDNDSIASVVEINREEDEAEEIINNDNE